MPRIQLPFMRWGRAYMCVLLALVASIAGNGGSDARSAAALDGCATTQCAYLPSVGRPLPLQNRQTELYDKYRKKYGIR